ncbi:MAG TPA: hypothetical protein ENK04_15035 [Gammaproteobacteria bacterium]|nr:hypothetical protein [Gammaproteobacteria bacterium]
MNSRIFIFLFVSIIPGQQAFCSGGMAANFGAFTTGVADNGTKRYRVGLDEAGQLLLGRPDDGVIELITIDAPDTEIRQILIRETKNDHGEVSLLITAPNGMLEKLKRATVYLKPAYAKLKFIENIDGYWEQRNPVSISLVQKGLEQKPENHIVAFQIVSFGEKRLVKDASHFLENNDVSLKVSAGRASDSNITSALWPWIMSGVLLVMAWFISCWMHTLNWRGGH